MKYHRSCAGILIALGLCFIAGCMGYQSRKIYSAPQQNFDVPVPDSGLFTYEPAKIQEASDDLGGRVVFYDTQLFKILTSITYRRLPADPDGVSSDAGKRKAAVRGFFRDYALPELFDPVSGDTEVLMEDFVGTGNDVEYFAVVRISGGSVLTDGVGKSLDSVRALLIFPNGGYMYMLGFDNITLRAMMAAPSESAKVFDRVSYQRHSNDVPAPGLENAEDRQLELQVFAAVALERLTEFKSSIYFK